MDNQNFSNICGKTYILTKDGYYLISELEHKIVNIWNGVSWDQIKINKNNKKSNETLYKITFNDGSELKCTENQKFNINKNIYTKMYDIKTVTGLKVNDKIIELELPILDGNINNDILYPYTHGYYCGNMLKPTLNKDEFQIISTKNNLKYINLTEDKEKLKRYLNFSGKVLVNKRDKLVTLLIPTCMKITYDVPINASLNNKIKWLSGMFDAVGVVTKKAEAKYIHITTTYHEFLYKVKLMCNTIGTNPILSKHVLTRKIILPDGSKKIDTLDYWKLFFNSEFVYKLFNELGLTTNYLSYNKNEINIDQDIQRYASITEIIKISDNLDTYHCHKSKSEMTLVNSLLI